MSPAELARIDQQAASGRHVIDELVKNTAAALAQGDDPGVLGLALAGQLDDAPHATLADLLGFAIVRLAQRDGA